MDDSGRRQPLHRAVRVARRFLRRRAAKETPSDFYRSLSDAEQDLVERVNPYTLTGPERIIATADAVDYVVRRGIHGALVECGVWRGGSVLAMILALQARGVSDRDIYLYDTFEGMTQPSAVDVSRFDEPALRTWEQAQATGRRAWDWFFRDDVFTLEGVQALLYETGYPRDRLHFVVGRVENTIPEKAPSDIAVLRLDTDWYESTLHELRHLYPRLAEGGVLIVDDYGHWDGCRRAVDDFFASGNPVLLSRTDYSGRLAIKQSGF